MSNADLKYAAIVCALLLAAAACTRAIALAPVEHAAVLLELATLFQLVTGVGSFAVLLRPGRAETADQLTGLSAQMEERQ